MKSQLALLATICCILGFAVPSHAQSDAEILSLPSNQEISELSSKAAEKVTAFTKAMTLAAPYLDEGMTSNYLEGAKTTDLILAAIKNNGPSAYSLVSLLASLDDLDADASKAALTIMSRIAANSISGNDQRSGAIFAVLELTDSSKSLYDISELIMHATLRYVQVEEGVLRKLTDNAK